MKIIAEKARIDDIADAVRQKLNVETQYKLSEIPAAINNIYVGGELEPLNVAANGDYYPETGVEGFNEVHVAVPNTYAAGDEDKVVHNGELIAQTARSTPITQNGTYSTVLNSEVEVNVSGGGGATLVPKSINANGTYDPASDNADGYSPVTVSVPNTYAASDEGKVVSNGALVAQGSDTVTQNGTVDTTLISSLIVSVSGGGGTMQSKTVTPGASQQVVQPDSGYAGLSFVTVEGDADLVAGNIKKDVEIFGVTGNYEGSGGGGAVVQPLSVTQNGTYNPPSGVDGYAPVTVNVSGAGGYFDGDLIALLTEDQGSLWIDTGYDVSNVTDFLFFKYLSGQTTVYDLVYKAKSDIAVYTGGADVYTPIFTVTRPFNVRIYNNNLWVSFNGVGANTNGALCYTGGNFADFMSTVQGN